jgi:hypothetical protein
MCRIGPLIGLTIVINMRTSSVHITTVADANTATPKPVQQPHMTILVFCVVTLCSLVGYGVVTQKSTVDILTTVTTSDLVLSSTKIRNV